MSNRMEEIRQQWAKSRPIYHGWLPDAMDAVLARLRELEKEREAHPVHEACAKCLANREHLRKRAEHAERERDEWIVAHRNVVKEREHAEQRAKEAWDYCFKVAKAADVAEQRVAQEIQRADANARWAEANADLTKDALARVAGLEEALVFIRDHSDARIVPWNPATATLFQDIWTIATQALTPPPVAPSAECGCGRNPAHSVSEHAGLWPVAPSREAKERHITGGQPW